jgi:hypothetical protein
MTDDIDPPDQSDPAEKALALARGAEHEHRVMNSPEGVKLLDAVGDAMAAYWQFLEHKGVITDGFEMLVAKCVSFGWEVELLNGAVDRLYPKNDDEHVPSVEGWGRGMEWPRKPIPCDLDKSIWDEAKEAAQAAARAKLDALPHDCAGDAWVAFDLTDQSMVPYLKKQGIGSEHGRRGYCVYAALLHSVNTQNISVHESAAAAAVAVFQKYGARCSTTSKLD